MSRKPTVPIKKISYKEAFVKGAAAGAVAGAGLGAGYLGLSALERRNPGSPLMTASTVALDLALDGGGNLLDARDILREPLSTRGRFGLVAISTAVGAVVTGGAAMFVAWGNNKQFDKLNPAQAGSSKKENQTHVERLTAQSVPSSAPSLG